MSDDFKEKLRSISFATRKHPTQVREDRLSDDLDAYARLRKNGVQPQGIDGAADIEKKATERFEIEMGMTAQSKKGLAQAKSLVKDLG